MLIIGNRYRDRIEARLQEFTTEQICWMPDNTDIDPTLAGHTDLSLFSPDQKILFTAASVADHIVNELTYSNNKPELRIIPNQRKQYPENAGLCVCTTGKYTFYKNKTIHPAVLPHLKGICIEVKQGYTKCSICVVNENTIITADDDIYRKALRTQIDVLKISPGHIRLEGYDYGFIGGAAFLLNNTTMAFTGTLDKHPDKERILACLRRNSVKPAFLSDEPIFDIGGALLLP